MKRYYLPITLSLLFSVSQAQQTFTHRDPQARFLLAKELMQKEQYVLAYPILKELQQQQGEAVRAEHPVQAQEVDYYTLVCALKQNEPAAESLAQQYIGGTRNNARVQQLNFHLGEYYFRKQQFATALPYYEAGGIDNLSNREIADAKFHQGYGYFTLQQFDKAKPLLNSIRQVKDDPNYVDANYYYGFIAFRDRQYADALESFRVVENNPAYESVVPYYIAQIYYVQGRKDEALDYAQRKLKEGKAQFYDLELKQLLGHALFEKKQYAQATPYLQDYVTRSKKVRREDLYELSYAYYQTAQYPKAIDGFKQLSGKEDSLSLHAMYLLGDAYLKTGQKANARSAFLFGSANNGDAQQREISRFNYAKLSYELGYQDEALRSLEAFITDYPASDFREEATDLLVGALTNTSNYRQALALIEGMKYPSQNARRLYPRILYGRATELINDGQLVQAEELLDKALKDANIAAVLPFVNFWKGELAFRSDRLDDAIRFYNAYLQGGAPVNGEVNPNNAKYNLGYAYYRKQNYPVAQTFFEPLARNVSLNSDPVTQDAYVRSADAHYMNRSYNQARGMYDNVIKYSWPQEDYATYQRAMIAGINSSNEKISNLNTLVRKFPASPLVMDATMEIANTYLAEEQYREAIPYLQTVAKAGGNSSLKPQAYLKQGIAQYNLNNNTDAVANYRRVISDYPNSPEAETALDNLKAVYVETGRPDEYAAVMREAGKPLSVSAEDSLTFAAAELKYEGGNADLALQALDNYLQRFASGAYTTNAQYYRAEIFGTRKDWKNALTAYSYVAERAPNIFADRAVLQAARIAFFELKDYPQAERFYTQLKGITATQEGRLEAMRGLLRSQFLQKKWNEAVENARELLAQKSASAEDKALAAMAIGKAAQLKGTIDEAIANFKTVVSLNKAAIGAEARYEIANSYFGINRLEDAEKAAFEVINKAGSYEFWVTRSYILLGDIYWKQKDYFNAKATFQSVVDNSLNAELKAEAQDKLAKVTAEEAQGSKVATN